MGEKIHWRRRVALNSSSSCVFFKASFSKSEQHISMFIWCTLPDFFPLFFDVINFLPWPWKNSFSVASRRNKYRHNFLSLPAIQNLKHSNISRHQVDLYVSCHAVCSKTLYTAKENLNLYGCYIFHSGVSKKIGLVGFFTLDFYWFQFTKCAQQLFLQYWSVWVCADTMKEDSFHYLKKTVM